MTSELGNPESPEERFRAVNKYAYDHGFDAAFPTFYEAEVYGTWLFKKNVAKFQDISVKDLGNPKSPEERFRAVNKYAYDHGFDAAFPNFNEADTKEGKVYGTWLLKKDVAEFRDIPVKDLGDPKSLEDRFRAVNKYASNHGFGGAFPNFNEADTKEGKVHGTWLLKKDVAEFRDVLTSELGNPKSPEERFRAVNKYAYDHGFDAAFPTFYEAKVYGAWLLKKNIAKFQDISVKDLGNPKSPEERFRAVNKYAHDHGFVAAFPNFNEADTKEGKLYGAWLLKKDVAEFRDIPFYDLLKLLIRPGDIIYGYESGTGHVGIIVSNDNKDLVVREAYPTKGVANISLRDFCDCGGYHKEIGYWPNYKKIMIVRAKCDDETAAKAAEKAKANWGDYDAEYLLWVPAVVPLTAIPTLFAWKALWDQPNLWYCSKFVYKMYFRAGLDLYPKTKKCLNPAVAFLTGEYPYIFGDCPWWVITPNDIINSKYVYPIWSWKK